MEKDNHFLLDLCLRYDWMSVKLCLAVLDDAFDVLSLRTTTTRFYHRRNSVWRKQRDLVEAAKRQLTATDKWGNNILHAVCFYKPPLRIVTAIMNAASRFPDGPLQLHRAVNSKHATPLCIAACSGASARVIHELLEPQAPNLIEGWSAVAIADRNAKTPFVGLTQRYEMLRKIPTRHHQSPALDDIDTLPPKHNIFTGQVIVDNYADSMRINNSPPTPLFSSYWHKIEILIQAGWFAGSHSDDEDDRFCKELQLRCGRRSTVPLLHGAAYLADTIPPVLTDLIIRCHQNMIHNDSLRAGCGGVLPLHLAVTVDTNHTKKQFNNAAVNARGIYHRKYFIQQLLKADPSTASCPVPGTHRLPFTQAVASGFHWNIMSKEQGDELLSCPTYFYDVDSSEECCHHRAPIMEEGPLHLLWKCFPDALYTQDPVTGLYPFMLAATHSDNREMTSKVHIASKVRDLGVQQRKEGKKKHSDCDCLGQDEDISQLDTVYNLLRLFPEAIKIR